MTRLVQGSRALQCITPHTSYMAAHTNGAAFLIFHFYASSILVHLKMRQIQTIIDRRINKHIFLLYFQVQLKLNEFNKSVNSG